MQGALTSCVLALLLGVPAAIGAAPHLPPPADPLTRDAPPVDYAALPAPRALAMVPGAPATRTVISQGRSSDLAAATDALERCRAANDANAPCELVWLNDERITTGAEIRARLPDAPHPLFLWRYETPVATLYLAGSIHVLKETLHPLPVQFEMAFQASDHLVVEVDLSRYPPVELQQRTLDHARLPAGTTLATFATPDLVLRLARRLPRYDLTPAAVVQVNPAMISQQLLIARLLALGYEPDYGVEQHYLARRGDRTLLELESLETQLALLLDQPMATQLDMLEDALAMEPGIEPVVADLLTAWLAGDDDTFRAAFNTQGRPSALLDGFQRAAVDDRNVAMAARIVDYLAAPGRYFVLVGSGHLVGDSGIVALLAQRGIEGRRIRSDERP